MAFIFAKAPDFDKSLPGYPIEASVAFDFASSLTGLDFKRRLNSLFPLESGSSIANASVIEVITRSDRLNI